MITLANAWTYAIMFGVAAVMGGVGGLVYELLHPFRRRTGLIERPNSVGKSHFDLGSWASIIVGAVAAIAAMWIFPPETSINLLPDGSSNSTTSYDLVKVVGLSLIVGSAGGTFITAMQSRVLLLVQKEQLAAKNQKSADATQSLEKLKDLAVSPGFTTEAVISSIDGIIDVLGNSTTNGNPSEVDF